jgi:hypothetical protein
MSEVTAKVYGFDVLATKIANMFGPAVKDAILQANDKSADEFMALVRFACPQEANPHNGHLIDTLKKSRSGPMGVLVSIGDENHKYPFHLEVGHRMPNGTHVPGLAFWFPARRVLAKRMEERTKRAERAAIKAVIGSSTSDPSA